MNIHQCCIHSIHILVLLQSISSAKNQLILLLLQVYVGLVMYHISKRKVKHLIIIILLFISGYEFIRISQYFIRTIIKQPNEIEISSKEIQSEIKIPTNTQNIEAFNEATDYETMNEYDTQANTDEDVKFILLMSTGIIKYPFTIFGEDNTVFVENDCEHVNCYVTYNKSYLAVESFDMVAFNLPDLETIEAPELRSPQQKYAFFSIESPQYNPVCTDIYDDFFNLTFTYRLSSDYRFWFFEIYDFNDTVIGPPVDVWPTFEYIDDELKSKLDRKTKVAAWFVSNCETKSGREAIAIELHKELRERYDYGIDIYGLCGNFVCPRRYAEKCNRKIEEEYVFYLAFENSIAEDYVTEKILLAVNNYAVPIVYGGANYSRFLPPDSYLDIKQLGVSEVARLMHKAIVHREYLYEYFKWTTRLAYRHISKKNIVCKICEVLNDKTNVTRTHPEFRNWWNAEGWENECTLTHDFF